MPDSIAVGVPRNGEKALRAIRESHGLAVNVSDREIMEAQQLLGRECGVFGEPAASPAPAGVKKLCEQGLLGEDDTEVSCGHRQRLKDVANAIRAAGEPLVHPGSMDALLGLSRSAGLW